MDAALGDFVAVSGSRLALFIDGGDEFAGELVEPAAAGFQAEDLGELAHRRGFSTIRREKSAPPTLFRIQ